MHIRPQTLEETVTAALGTTARFKLPEGGLLLGYLLETTGSIVSGAQDEILNWRWPDTFTKIETVLNGNYAAQYQTGQSLLFREHYNSGRNPVGWWRSYATGTNRSYLCHSFGRYFGDLKYALDLSQVDHAEIKITNNATDTNWGTPDHTVTAIILENPMPGYGDGGFFRTRLYREWTTVQNETKYISLPTDGLLRKIYLQAMPSTSSAAFGTFFTNLMYTIKYMARSGKEIMFDDSGWNLMHLEAFLNHYTYWTGGVKDTSSGYSIQTGPGRKTMSAFTATQEGSGAAATIPTQNDQPQSDSKVLSREADVPPWFISGGFAPENTLVFRHDLTPTLEDMLDLEAQKQVQLEIATRDSSSAASGTNRVFIEQLVTSREW